MKMQKDPSLHHQDYSMQSIEGSFVSSYRQALEWPTPGHCAHFLDSWKQKHKQGAIYQGPTWWRDEFWPPEWTRFCFFSVGPLKNPQASYMTSRHMMYLEHILLKLIEYIKMKKSWEKDVKDLWMLVKWLEHTKALNLKASLPSCSYISSSFDHPPFKLLHGFNVLL